MKFRKAITIIAAVCAVLFIGSIAMAAQQVAVKVTSESVQKGSVCSKAGGFELGFDKATVLNEGDRIEIKLPLGVTICTVGGFNLQISKGSSIGYTNADVAGLSNPAVIAPLYFVEGPTGANISVITGAVYFTITGAVGDQFIYLDVVGTTPGLGNDFITVGSDEGDRFSVLFFDQKTNADYTIDGLWVDDADADTVFDDDATLAQNTLCINVSSPEFTATVVNASMDSKEDYYKFVPSNPQIADIVNPQTIVQYVCKDQKPPFISIPSRAEQADCPNTFDSDLIDEIGLCSPQVGFDVILRNASTQFTLTQYQVQMEILVNGNTGANGVYWSGETPYVKTFAEGVDACNNGGDKVALGIKTLYDSAGTDITKDFTGTYKNCDVKSADRAVKFITAQSDLGFIANQRAIWFDVPRMSFDLDDIKAGDVVTVRISLVLPPCKVVGVVDVKWGTFGCAAAATSRTLTFPYYTALKSIDWWNGMAISNLGSTAGTFTATVYEQDGDVGTFTSPTIAAKSQWVALLSSVGFTKTAGGGTLGDSSCFIIVEANFSADGFAMLSSLANSAVDGSESMGYLPRTPIQYYDSDIRVK